MPVRDKIHAIARREGISYVPGPCDELADAITAHSGDEVVLDSTGDLLIALERAGILDPVSATLLHAEYIKERDR